MDLKQLAFAADIERLVSELCEVVFNVKSAAQMENIMGLTQIQLKSVIGQIVEKIPYTLLEVSSKKKMDELQAICAREFIFFQLQEKWNDPHYQAHLTNFIRIFIKDLMNKF